MYCFFYWRLDSQSKQKPALALRALFIQLMTAAVFKAASFREEIPKALLQKSETVTGNSLFRIRYELDIAKTFQIT